MQTFCLLEGKSRPCETTKPAPSLPLGKQGCALAHEM